MGILTTSEHPQAAPAFLSYLLSAKIQEQDRNTTFPVNREIFEKELAMDSRKFDFSFACGSDQGLFFTPQYPDAEDRANLGTWVENLTTPASTDQSIRNIIMEQMSDCLLGEITAEKAAQEALRSLNLYLSE